MQKLILFFLGIGVGIAFCYALRADRFFEKRFYKKLLFEIVETLCSICLYLGHGDPARRNRYSGHMIDHYAALKEFSQALKEYSNQ